MAKQTASKFPYPLVLAIGLGVALGLSLALRHGARGVDAAADKTVALRGLVDQRGAAFDPQTLRGRYALVYFGFTRCPDACPTALFSMATALRSLDRGANIQAVFVSVDPQHDTAPVLAAYLTHFGPDTIGLSGRSEQIKNVEQTFGVVAIEQRDTQSPDGYSVDHSNEFLLLSPQGALLRRIPATVHPTELARRLRSALRSAAASL